MTEKAVADASAVGSARERHTVPDWDMRPHTAQGIMSQRTFDATLEAKEAFTLLNVANMFEAQRLALAVLLVIIVRFEVAAPASPLSNLLDGITIPRGLTSLWDKRSTTWTTAI
eukprot:5467814-Amphidinium_carterae.1